MRFWLDKAPMVFLIVAAVAFVIGLNLFAYWSVQVCYDSCPSLQVILLNLLQPLFVSLATSTFTGLHSICTITVTAWFIYELKHESSWAKCIHKNTEWIRTIIGWLAAAMNSIFRLYRGIKKLLYRKCRPGQLHLLRNIYWYAFHV